MKWIKILIPIVCILWIGYNKFSPEETIVDMVHTHRSNTAKEISGKYLAFVSGTGGGIWKKIDNVYLSFSLNRPLEIDVARKIIVDATETLAKRLSEDERLREYLLAYPCGIETIEIDVDALAMKDHRSSPVSYAKVIRNEIYFRKLHPAEGNEKEYFESLLVEPYEESRRIVMEQLGPGGATWIPDDWQPESVCSVG